MTATFNPKVGEMAAKQQVVVGFKDDHTPRMFDRWIKNSRDEDITLPRTLPDHAVKLVKSTVTRALPDLSIHTDALSVDSKSRKARCTIATVLVYESGLIDNFLAAQCRAYSTIFVEYGWLKQNSYP